MSGHNKWSKIKNKKAVTDSKKSKIFGKLARLITTEAKKSGGDATSPNVRAVVEKAREFNMPNDNIDRAIAKAKETGGAQMENITYEAYGPGGVALMIEVLTDNRNKTAAEVRHTLSKNGLALANPGSASWAFEKKDGEWVPKSTMPISPEDTSKLEALIDEFDDNEDVQEIFTNAEHTDSQ